MTIAISFETISKGKFLMSNRDQDQNRGMKNPGKQEPKPGQQQSQQGGKQGQPDADKHPDAQNRGRGGHNPNQGKQPDAGH